MDISIKLQLNGVELLEILLKIRLNCLVIVTIFLYIEFVTTTCISVASAVLINRERLEAVDFLAMINPSSVRFVLRKPPLSYISNIFFLPFYWTVWISIFVVLFLFGFVLYFILNWETKYKEKVINFLKFCKILRDFLQINFQDKFGLKDIFLIAFEILCQQGEYLSIRDLNKFY